MTKEKVRMVPKAHESSKPNTFKKKSSIAKKGARKAPKVHELGKPNLYKKKYAIAKNWTRRHPRNMSWAHTTHVRRNTLR